MRAVDMIQRRRAAPDVAAAVVAGSTVITVEPEQPFWKGKKFWTPSPGDYRGMWVDGICTCNTWILFDSLATPEERATPRCSLYPFAHQGAA